MGYTLYGETIAIIYALVTASECLRPVDETNEMIDLSGVAKNCWEYFKEHNYRNGICVANLVKYFANLTDDVETALGLK